MSQLRSPTVNGRWTLAFVSSSAGRRQTESGSRWPWANVRKVNLTSQGPSQELCKTFARRILPNIEQMNRSKPARHAVQCTATRGFPRSALAYSSECPGCAHRRILSILSILSANSCFAEAVRTKISQSCLSKSFWSPAARFGRVLRSQRDG